MTEADVFYHKLKECGIGVFIIEKMTLEEEKDFIIERVFENPNFRGTLASIPNIYTK